MKIFFLLIFSLLVTSCQTVPEPVDDYALARAALEAAREVQSSRYSPGLWHQAENFYKQGQYHFREKDWSAAKTFFIKSRISAEKAENSSRLIRQKTGEVL